MTGNPGRVRQADIAAATGVSPATVCAVLTGRTQGIHVGAATRQRVLNAARRMDYRPNAAARRLRLGQSHVVGLVVDDLALPFLATLTQVIVSELRAAGYDCLLMDQACAASAGVFAGHCRQTRHEGKVDAFVLVGASRGLSDDDIRAMTREGIPIALVERRIADGSVPSVTVDNQAGGRMAVEHLAALGRRRIAMIAGPAGNAMADDRTRGARAAARVAGIPMPRAAGARGDWSLESGHDAMLRLLPYAPDAVFAANDMMAIGAMAALDEAGLVIPDQVAVVGFDDSPPAGFCRPPLTTIRQPPDLLGRAAVQLVLNAMGRREAATPMAPILPALVVRRSTQPNPTARAVSTRRKSRT